MSDKCDPVGALSDPVEARLRIRALGPSDRRLLTIGFDRLSRESRRSRYFRPKNQLTEDELSQLTRCDGNGHLALGAFELSKDGVETAVIGVARYFRLAQNPGTAELSVAVVDDRQGRGVGRHLVRCLLEEARSRGITHMICHVLADNERMLKLAQSVFDDAILQRQGDVISGDFRISGRSNAPLSKASFHPEG